MNWLSVLVPFLCGVIVVLVLVRAGAKPALGSEDDTAWVAADEAGIQGVDISDPANPEKTVLLDTPANAAGLKINGDYLYVADMSTVQVVDISNPDNPEIVGSYTPSNPSAIAVQVAGDRLYISLLNGGFDIADLADPENPAFLGTYTSSGVYGVSTWKGARPT